VQRTEFQLVICFLRQEHVFITDMTARYALITLQGPRSRELLQSLTSVDLGNDAFSFRSVKTIDIGLARAICCRITYVGELGYELFIPVEQARLVYDYIVGAGLAVDLKHAGLKALGSLRMVRTVRLLQLLRRYEFFSVIHSAASRDSLCI
jgi:glycine cleavage system aminomethyltransferase T